MFRGVRVGTEADHFTSEFQEAYQDVPVQLGSPESVGLIGFGVDFQAFPILCKIAEDFIHQCREIFVEDTFLRIRGITDHVVEVSHDIEVTEPFHFPQQGLQVASVGFLPVLAFIVVAVIWIGVLKIMDRYSYLVEVLGCEQISVEIPVIHSQSHLYAFEYLEFLGCGPTEGSFRHFSSYPVDFCLLGSYIEYFGDLLDGLLLDVRNIEIAMVGET